MATNIKSRFMAIIFALVCMVGLIPVTTAHAASYNTSGYAMSGAKQKVYDDVNCTVFNNRWIYDYEGITVLSISGSSYEINYSTTKDASGRTGYVKNPNFRINDLGSTCAGTVNTSTNVYGGPQIATALKMGSLSAGEKVAVIYSESGWYYVEYNTTAGRKRGYVQAAYVNADYPSVLGRFPQSGGPLEGFSAPAQPVYGGPSDEYGTIGSISSGDWVTVYKKVDNKMDVWYYIGYPVSGGLAKFGYILVH